MDDPMSQKELNEIVTALDGAYEDQYLEASEKLGLDPCYAWDLMESQGFLWDGDRWVKRRCSRQ